MASVRDLAQDGISSARQPFQFELVHRKSNFKLLNSF